MSVATVAARVAVVALCTVMSVIAASMTTAISVSKVVTAAILKAIERVTLPALPAPRA